LPRISARWLDSGEIASLLRSARSRVIASEKLLPGFTNRYNVSKLVYYEAGYDASGAIVREKQIKAGSRRKKIDLINRLNSEWRDLYEEL
jgi:predicted GIY-YIG superfamily endonuclease